MNSAWSLEQLEVAAYDQVRLTGATGTRDELQALAEGIRDRARELCVMLSEDPRARAGWVKSLTCRAVVECEDELKGRLAARGVEETASPRLDDLAERYTLDAGQREAVETICKGDPLAVVEGAAGAGAPAAIAAPFLVALGFDPVTSIAVALLGDATPASWGGAGLTTINGGAALVDAGLSTVSLNAAMVGRFHMFGVLIIPFIMVGMVFGKKGFKGAVPYLCFAGVSTCTVMFLLSNFVGAEVTSMGTGLISMLLSLAYVKLVGVKTPEKFRHHAAAQQRKYSAFRAMSPYIYMLVLLPLVRYGFPAVVPNGFAVMCTFGYIFWVDVVILVCGMLGAATLGVSAKQYRAVCSRTVGNVLPVLITMGSLLIVSYIMQSPTTGMMNLLASDIAAVVGRFYPAAAVLIGSSGAFITGTGLGSNIMFAQMHIDAAASLGMNPITIFAGQNAGASLGNLICPNNTVAACATVDAIGRENEVMKHTLRAFAIVLALYMVLAMLYTCVLFPNYGM